MVVEEDIYSMKYNALTNLFRLTVSHLLSCKNVQHFS